MKQSTLQVIYRPSTCFSALPIALLYSLFSDPNIFHIKVPISVTHIRNNRTKLLRARGKDKWSKPP